MPGKLYTDIAEKRKVLRELYGGMMDTKALCKELGGMDRHTVREWARNQGIGVQIGKRIKYDTDEVAKVIVMGRGMHA